MIDRRSLLVTGAVAPLVVTGSAWGRQAPPPVEAYAALPSFEMVAISPSGQRLAFVTGVGAERAVLVSDPVAQALLGAVRVADAKVRSIDWLGDDRLLVQTSFTGAAPLIGAGRAEWFQGQVFDVATRRVLPLTRGLPDVLQAFAGTPQIREIDGETRVLVPLISLERSNDLHLFSIDPATGRGRVVERGDFRTGGYVINAEGEAIARTSYDGRSGEWALMLKRGGFFESVWTENRRIDTPSLIGLAPDGRSVIVADRPEGAARTSFTVVSPEGARAGLDFENEPTGLLFHPKTGVMIGQVFSSDEAGEGSWLEISDPEAGAAWRAIRRAFQDRSPTLLSWSDNFRRVAVRTWGLGDSGTVHYVNLDSGRADIIGDVYPGIPGEAVGEVRAIAYSAADGMRIPGYLTLPPGRSEERGLPLVVLPHGGPAARDYLAFDWWAQAIASRGYAVLQPNFRGSDGISAQHLEAGYGEWGRKMQTDLSDGVRWLVQEGVADPERVAIVGASYGGYAAMAGPTLDPGVYRCAVAVAGVSDLRRMVEWSAEQAGRDDSPVVRYWNRFMGADRLGDRGLDEISPARQAARADAPILMIHGRDDTVVPYEQTRIFANALRAAGKPHEVVDLNGEDHWLSRPETRLQMLRETIRYLETHVPPTRA
ncbi:MAG: alpha/beta hydrolase family protein [Brevundimonas sp.]